MPKQRRVAFKDACLAFDDDNLGATHCTKSPDANVYLYVKHNLIQHPHADSVLEAAQEKVRRFYKQTFYKNEHAFQCCMAALAIALRGLNVDRCFWGIGPGGVGQSLFTAHLDAVLGHLHAYLDTNIYYSDEEMRQPHWMRGGYRTRKRRGGKQTHAGGLIQKTRVRRPTRGTSPVCNCHQTNRAPWLETPRAQFTHPLQRSE